VDTGDARADRVHSARAEAAEGVVVPLAPHAADVVEAFVHLREQFRNLLGRVLQVGVERDQAFAARTLEAGEDRMLLKLPFSSTTRRVGVARELLQGRIAAERSRLPSLTKITS
jgi:hypothetical protein